jgi:flagellar hook-associated protein 1
MTGTFGSLNTALTALRYQRVAMDTASQNIANVGTEGYVRRRAEAQSLGAPATIAMWSRYDGAGDGVSATGTTRLADALLDARSRTEHGKQSYLDTRSSVLTRVESALGEPGDSGVAAALSAYRSAWQDLESTPDGSAARNQVLAAGGKVADALKAQSANVTTELGTQRAHLVDVVTQAGSLATNLAAVNKSIAEAKGAGLDSSDLQDQRDLLGQKLAELTGATTTARADGGLDVSVGGQSLVSGGSASALTIASGVRPDGTGDGQPLSLAIGGAAVATAAFGGEIGATSELITTTLPGFKAQLDAVATQLADSVNALHASGYDQDGTAGTAFFAYDPADPAGSISVAITDPRKVAASAQPGGGLGTGVAERLGEPGAADAAYARVVNGFANQVASAKQAATTQQLMTTQVDSSREALSGVSIDEETVNLAAAQHAYEAAARVMSTMDQVLDTLINRMGV